MKTLVITRDNYMGDVFHYSDDKQLNDNLGSVVESILGLNYLPNEVPSIGTINTILSYQNYEDRLNVIHLDKVDFEGKDLILYKGSKSLVLTFEELLSSPEVVLPMVVDISSSFVNFYFNDITPKYKRSSLKYLLDVLKENLGLNYILINR